MATEFPPGALAVVAVPLGNPEDITLRALRFLAEADVVAAEDTRTAARLLAHHGIRARTISYHDWNETERAERLLEILARGERVALVAEAGTPGISDPGFDLVRGARERGFPVIPVPGPSAVAAFLSASGLPTHAFSFFGFPPKPLGRRRALFESLRDRTETLVFYESPHRIVATLRVALEALGDRECALAREMTKLHEEFLWGPLSRVLEELASRSRVRGEVCWGVRGRSRREPAGREDVEAVLARLRGAGLRPRDAAKELARRTGISTREAYALLTREGPGRS